ncbi:MAG: hypothetical protein ABIK97_07610 [candidate division WOR-3 bacterium]
MGDRRSFFFIIAAFLFSLSLIRLFEGIIKRELRSEWEDLKEEYALLLKEKEQLEEEIKRREGEKILLSLQKETAAKKEPYLRIYRKDKIAKLKMEDKTLREMRFSVKGRRAIAGEVLLPSGILQVKEKMAGVSFYIPEWFYELLGKEIPQDTLTRKVKDAFGKYCLSLGGDICLSGKIREEVPDGALDLIYLEFEDGDIEAIYNTLKDGASVFFY